MMTTKAINFISGLTFTTEKKQPTYRIEKLQHHTN